MKAQQAAANALQVVAMFETSQDAIVSSSERKGCLSLHFTRFG